MIITPLGTASAYSDSTQGWTCNLLNCELLLDAAPQAMLALRSLKITPDDLEAVIITHTHGDHIFGFPFILAERSPDLDPLPVIGPEGTEAKLTRLCELAFSHAAPDKMAVQELPTRETSEVQAGSYRFLAAPTDHSPESLGYKITGPDGTRLGYSGDAAWSKGLREILTGVDAAMVEMTYIDEANDEHLSLHHHLLRLMETVPAPAPIYLTHLGRPRIEYLNALQKMARTLPGPQARDIFRVVPVEELKEYSF